MDYFMVDVTDIEGVICGDVVTLLGRDGERSISVKQLAEWSHSFPYELVVLWEEEYQEYILIYNI